MGIVKLYIMYWGVFTVIIIAWVAPKVLPNITKSKRNFCAIFTMLRKKPVNWTYILKRNWFFSYVHARLYCMLIRNIGKEEYTYE